MEAHHLDRRGEAVGVFALIGVVEGGTDVSEARVGDLGGEGNLDGVFLVLVAELAVALEFDAACVDAFGGELGAGLLFHLGKGGVDAGACAGVEGGEAGDDVVAAQVGHHHAPGGEN